VDFLKRAAASCAVSLNRDVAAEWGGAYSIRLAADPKDIAPGECAFSILDALPAAPGDVAYHDRDGKGVPFALLALTTCRNLDDLTIGMAHEFDETAGDPECNTWADNGAGVEFAQELCDSVEAFSYEVDGILVSDFVTRAFFAPGEPGPYHCLASMGIGADLAGPFATAAGGYQLTRPVGGNVVQVTGEIRAHRLAHKKHWNSRSYRRGLRL
jgi:hypothetical protein